MFKLREYQQKAVDDIVNFVKDGGNYGVAALPVAAGKSLVIAESIRQLGDPKTIVIQPSVELLNQNYNKYITQGGEANIFSASAGIKEVGNVTYVTPASIKNCAELFKGVELVLIDECHHGVKPNGMISRTIKQLDNPQVIGLTATPFTLKYTQFEGAVLKVINRVRPRYWKKIFHVTQVEDLYDQGYLCLLRFTSYNFNMRTAATKGSDFEMESVSKVAREYGALEFASEVVNRGLAAGKKRVLVFAPTVVDAHDLRESIPNSVVIDGKMKNPERKQAIQDYKEGKVTTLINFGTLTTGFDEPLIDLLVCLRPTKSYSLHYQILGRAVRISEGKELADIVDLSGNYQEFGEIKNLRITPNDKGLYDAYVSGRRITGPRVIVKSNERITFGKHKGKLWDEVPINYLKWIRDNYKLNSEFAIKHVKPHLKRILG